MSINRVILTGNLTADAVLRETNTNGTPVLNFSIAVNDRRKNQQTGEWESHPNYVPCVLFGGRAESLAKYLTVGRKVTLEGKLRWNEWTDKNGNKRQSHSVTIDEIEFMNAQRTENGGGDNYGGQGGYDAPAAPVDFADDDAPF